MRPNDTAATQNIAAHSGSALVNDKHHQQQASHWHLALTFATHSLVHNSAGAGPWESGRVTNNPSSIMLPERLADLNASPLEEAPGTPAPSPPKLSLLFLKGAQLPVSLAM